MQVGAATGLLERVVDADPGALIAGVGEGGAGRRRPPCTRAGRQCIRAAVMSGQGGFKVVVIKYLCWSRQCDVVLGAAACATKLRLTG